MPRRTIKPDEETITEIKKKFYKTFDTKGVNSEVLEDELVYNLLKVPKKETDKDMPHFDRTGNPNEVYHADLLELPDDKGYKYALVVVDAVSGITDAVPLKNKEAITVNKAFQQIFNRKILPKPKYQLTVDSGSEFKGINLTYFNNAGIYVKRAPKARHRMVSMAENRNKLIAVRLFYKQYAKEMLTGKINKEWVDFLPTVIESINETVALTPAERKKMKLKQDKQLPFFTHPLLEVGTKVRVALEYPKDYIESNKLTQTFRATDIRWTKETYIIDNVIINNGQPTLYILKGKPDVAYTWNRLQPIYKTEKLPPESVLLKENNKPKEVEDDVKDDKPTKPDEPMIRRSARISAKKNTST